jgi:transcriptional regulator GlxA family with amidase domain
VAGRPHSVIVVAFPDVQALDVVGPVEVFAMANRHGADPAYATEVVSASGGAITTSSGLSLATHPAATAQGPIDTRVLAGGAGTAAAMADGRLIGWLRDAAAGAARVTSVCSGAFLLAAAGQLDGRRATTHWSASDALARTFPAVEVDPDRIYERTATCGPRRASPPAWTWRWPSSRTTTVASWHWPWPANSCCSPSGRAGSHSSAHSSRCGARSASPCATCWPSWRSIPRPTCRCRPLARRAAMSVRTFARSFSHELGTTPAAFVQRSRVEAARRLLESTDGAVDDIARAGGFGTVETMHRAFRRAVRTTPAQYRRPFAVPA